MSIASPRKVPAPIPNGLPLLANGDRMKQPEFHRRYRACPDNIKFELIGGTVYMASPLRWPHGTYRQQLGLVLGVYQAGTPGVELGDNATVILGEESEPQPDLALRILEDYGGQSRLDEEQYVVGAPELLAEVAYSTRSIDMNQKRQDYQEAGVRECLVLCVEELELRWFHFESQREIGPNRQGVSKSIVFPGLWIHNEALLGQDGSRLIKVAQRGLASREHAAFVKRLRARRRKRP